ncbi:hypothetical protein [Nocardia sp. NPDC003345]
MTEDPDEISPLDNGSWARDREVYVQLLERERRRYAWVMHRYGDLTEAEAEEEAAHLYPFEDPDDEFYGMSFRDDAWHWAMRHLYGLYWITHPELEDRVDEYYDIE